MSKKSVKYNDFNGSCLSFSFMQLQSTLIGGNASLLPALKLKEFNFTSQSEAV